MKLTPSPVAAEYGYRDGSGADRVIKRLEEKAKSDRALSRRLKALAKEVSRVDPISAFAIDRPARFHAPHHSFLCKDGQAAHGNRRDSAYLSSSAG